MASYSDLFSEYGMFEFQRSEEMKEAIRVLQMVVAEQKRRAGQLRNRGKNILRNKKRTRPSTPRSPESAEGV